MLIQYRKKTIFSLKVVLLSTLLTVTQITNTLEIMKTGAICGTVAANRQEEITGGQGEHIRSTSNSIIEVEETAHQVINMDMIVPGSTYTRKSYYRQLTKRYPDIPERELIQLLHPIMIPIVVAQQDPNNTEIPLVVQQLQLTQQVILFPKNRNEVVNGIQFWCTSNPESKYPYLGLREFNIQRCLYPIIPCCYKRNAQNKPSSSYFKYYHGNQTLVDFHNIQIQESLAHRREMLRRNLEGDTDEDETDEDIN